MKNSVRRLASAAVLAALAVPTTSFATNGYFSDAYSTKNGGLAGAGVALPEDAMASATNPAGMVWVGQTGDIGGAIFSPHREYTVSGVAGTPDPNTGYFPLVLGTVKSDSNYFFIPHFGMNWMIDNNSSAGVAVYGNGGMNTDYPTSTYGGTFYGTGAGVDLSQLFVNGTYSRKINASSSWGVSLIGIYQRFKATGLQAFDQPGYSAYPGSVTDNGYDTSTGFTYKLGWQGEVAKGLTLGASYQGKASMSKFDKYKGLYAEGGNFDIPSTWTVGLAYDTAPSSKLVFDVQRINYSEVPSIANSISNFNPQNAPTNTLGGSSGPGFGWQDITVYKLGYQWATSPAWTWRVGYSHCDQPIPNKEVLFNILAPGVVQDEITFGFTNKLDKTSEWSYRMMYAASNTVTGPNAFTQAPAAQTIAIKMYEFQLEATYSWKF
ncbi:MAG: outer membrane protein transport protein [Gammaproteobacteria bacterium]